MSWPPTTLSQTAYRSPAASMPRSGVIHQSLSGTEPGLSRTGAPQVEPPSRDAVT
ncbi:MAG TPA: hypothetical protein VKV35_04320 [Streptosporangiaceae bacterium]|nr:hypothetical protein [Streptosporangiaceae bacterium]